MPAYPTSPAFCHSSSVSGTDQRGVSRTTTYGSFTCADVGATNSSYSLVFTTEPATSYSAGVDFTTSPVASFEDDGFVLPFTTTGQPVVFSDQDSAITGVQTYNFSAGVAVPTTSAIGTPESSDTLTAKYYLGQQGSLGRGVTDAASPVECRRRFVGDRAGHVATLGKRPVDPSQRGQYFVQMTREQGQSRLAERAPAAHAVAVGEVEYQFQIDASLRLIR